MLQKKHAPMIQFTSFLFLFFISFLPLLSFFFFQKYFRRTQRRPTTPFFPLFPREKWKRETTTERRVGRLQTISQQQQRRDKLFGGGKKPRKLVPFAEGVRCCRVRMPEGQVEGVVGGEKRGAAAADDHPRGHARSRGGLVSLGQSLAAESRARQETDGEGGGKGME